MASRFIALRWAATAACLLLGGALVQADPAPDLVPHHAVYKLTLTHSSGDKAPAAASGVITYDFSGSACEGYATSFRQMTELQPAEGESRISDMRSATFEDGAAKQFRFNSQTTYSSSTQDNLDGNAAKESDGSVAVAIEKPETTKAKLGSALFPTEHLRKVIEAARAGERLLTEPVYDGSETGRIVFDTLAVIGAARTSPSDDKAAQADALKSVRRWPVSISYFDRTKGDAQPNYILSFELYENGISRALKLDYGTFTLAGEMVDLKILPAVPCQR